MNDIHHYHDNQMWIMDLYEHYPLEHIQMLHFCYQFQLYLHFRHLSLRRSHHIPVNSSSSNRWKKETVAPSLFHRRLPSLLALKRVSFLSLAMPISSRISSSPARRLPAAATRRLVPSRRRLRATAPLKLLLSCSSRPSTGNRQSGWARSRLMPP